MTTTSCIQSRLLNGKAERKESCNNYKVQVTQHVANLHLVMSKPHVAMFQIQTCQLTYINSVT